jgi:PAS domain S-box-containing protein
MNSLITLLIVLAFAMFVLNRFYAVELREEHNNLEKCIRTFWAVLEDKGTEFRFSDGRLLVGDRAINGNFEAPDKVQAIFGGVATVFMGDERISTNVLDDEGKRAVGTRLVGPAYTAIFKEGRSYRGEAPILGHPYLTAYDPIRDKNGAIIGVLFVGVKKSAFQEHFKEIKSPIIVMLVVLLTSLAIVTFLLLRITRKLESAEANNLSFLRTLMETIPSPIFYKDAKGRYLGFNKAYETYVGMTQDQLIGKTPSELWPPDLAEKYQQQDQTLFENPGTQMYEGSMVIADGTRHDVIFHKATFSSEYGAVAGLVGIILDITERKSAEEETQRAYQQLNDIIEFLPDATFVVDKDKRVIAWNLAVEKMTGFGKEEMLGKGDYAYAVPFYGEPRPILIDLLDEDVEKMEHTYPFIKRVGRTLFTEICIPGMDGRESRCLWGTAAPLYDKRGKRVGGIESMRDVTEYKLVEAELRFRNLLFSTQLQASMDGILAVNENGKIVSWNKQFMDIFKISSSLLDAGDDGTVLKTVTEQAEDPQGFLERVRHIYAHPQETSKDEVLLKSGQVIDRYSAPMVDELGRYYGRVWYFRNITEARTAKDEIQNAYQQVLDIIEFLPDATFVLDKEKRVIAWNRSMEEMTGVTKEEMLGKGDHAYAEPFYGVRRPTLIDMIGKDDDELRANYDYVQKNGRTIFAQVTLPPLGKHDTRFVSSTASPLFDKHGDQVGSIQSIRDLTENRREYIEKSRLKAELHHSQMMQSVMVQLGHDLKTPLTPLITLLPIIIERLADPQLKRMVDICCENAHQLNELTDKALTFATLTSTPASAEREDIALAPALEVLLANRFGEVSCENAIAPDIVVQAERNQLNELLVNLISNAARYSTAQGVVRITAEQTLTSVTVAVRDDGIGLAPQHLERIFDEFFKVDESRHDLANLGLGLSVCKRIVLNHQGKIWAESPGIGQGTTILFTLPLNTIE